MKKLLIIFSVLLLTSCASTKRLTPNDRAALHSIAVAPHVKVKNHMYIKTRRGEIGSMLFGLAAIPLAVSADVYESSRVDDELYASHIKIRLIVKKAFMAELKRQREFKVVPPRAADAKIVLSISKYGLRPYYEYSKRYVPVMDIEAKLIDSNGKVLWRDHYSDNSFDNKLIKKVTLETLEKHPEKIAEYWAILASSISNKLVSSLLS